MKKLKSYFRYFFLVLAFCNSPILLAATDYPKPQGYVTDAAEVIDAASRQALENNLSEFERASKVEIAVATVPSLQGEAVENYANTLFKQWGIGKKGQDNGVLILVAPSEHKVRIEVGYGLESVLTDGLSGQIIRDQMVPYFKQNQYGEGLTQGISAIEKNISGGQTGKLEPSLQRQPWERLYRPETTYLIPLMLALFLILPFTALGVLVAFIMYVYPISSYLLLGIVSVVGGFLLDMIRLGRVSRGRGGSGGNFPFGHFGGYSGGGFSSGGGGFGGGGFGGFGGGSSGGGGASGGW